MKFSRRLAALGISSVLCSTVVPVPVVAAEAGIDGLSWLEGCWRTEDGRSQEVWVASDDQSMNGFAITVGEGKVEFYEILLIRKVAENEFIYTAHPSGQAAAPFVATELSGTRVTFLNPAHDYPQKIVYEREGNQLRASISLLDGENPRSFDKVVCE